MSFLLAFAEPTATVYTLSPGRIGAIVAGLLGLSGIALGALSLRRPKGPQRAVIAATAGVVGMAIASVVVATSDEGIGTGNGRAGAYVALVAGFAAVIVGLVAWRRRKNAT